MTKTQIFNTPIRVWHDPIEKLDLQTPIGPDDKVYGLYNHEDSVIWLNPDQSSEQARDTLLHEIMHVVDAHLGLELTHSQVASIGAALAQILAPWLKV